MYMYIDITAILAMLATGLVSLIFAYTYSVSPVGFCTDGGLSLKHNNTVSQVSSHDEIVLHHKGCLLGMQHKPTRYRYTLQIFLQQTQSSSKPRNSLFRAKQ